MTLPRDEAFIAIMPWPLITIDFEASALDPRSYPIEVGISRWVRSDAPIEVWSTLITPHISWQKYGFWSEDSEKIHGIRPHELTESGSTPTEAVMALNGLLSGQACYCDGGSYDIDWARKLSSASDVPAQIKLGSWHTLMSRLSPAGFARAFAWMEETVTPHRAGPDAANLMRAIAIGLGIEPGPAKVLG